MGKKKVGKREKMEILYKVHDNLYVNLTNRCPYACTFCLRQTMDRIGESDRLWLEREPSYEEVVEEFKIKNFEDQRENEKQTKKENLRILAIKFVL